MTSLLGGRSAAAERTRRTVLAAGLALFEAQGFEATTMEQVAAAAGVSVITVFRTVGSKESIVFSTREQEAARLGEAVLGAFPYGDPRRRVREALLTCATQMPVVDEEYARRLAVIESSPALQRTSFDFRRQVEQAVLGALPQPPTPAAAAAAAGAGAALHLALAAWHASGADPDGLRAEVGRALDALWPDLRAEAQPGGDAAVWRPSRNPASSSGGIGRANR